MVRIEKTFLVKELPKDLEKHQKAEIDQGYFIDAQDSLRFRKKDELYSVTKKLIGMPGDASIREHIELPISKEEFGSIWKLIPKKLSKTRYYYSNLGIGPELRIDVFHGNLEGFILIEMVFVDDMSVKDFSIPDWFGKDITGEQWVNNSFFASKSYEEVKKYII